MTDTIFFFACLALLFYTLYEIKCNLLGLTQLFLLQVLFFHTAALIFYRDIWYLKWNFGLLSLISNSERVIDNVFLAMSLCFFSLIAGCLFFDFLCKRNILETKIGFRAIKPSVLNKFVLFSILFILVFLLIQFAFIAPPTKIYDYFVGNNSDFDRFVIRRESTIAFYPYSIMQFTIIPFLFFCGLIQSIKLSNQRLKKYVILLFLILLFSQLAKYTKAGPALFIIQTLFCVTIAKRSKLQLSKYDFLFFITATLFVMIIVASVGDSVEFLSVVDRLLMIPNEVLFEYFGAIPESYPFGFGRGISYVQLIFGDAAGNYPGLPTHMHVAAVIRGNYNTVVNGFFLADAWAEFGWFGIIFVPFLAGLLIKWYDQTIVKVTSETVRRAMIVFSLSASYTLVTASITSSLITGGILLIPLFGMYLNRWSVPKKVEIN